MYKVGDESPDFTAMLTVGREFNLFNALKNSSVLINFIRGTWCEECTQHLRTIESWRNKLNERATPVTTIIITVEEEALVKSWLIQNPTTYLMAADEKGLVANMYGFMVPEDAYSKPGMMLIDSQKVIRMISSDLQKAQEQATSILKL